MSGKMVMGLVRSNDFYGGINVSHLAPSLNSSKNNRLVE